MFESISRVWPRGTKPLAEPVEAIRTLAALHQAGLSLPSLWAELSRNPGYGDIPVAMTTAIDDGVNPHDALRSLTTDAGHSWRALGACWAIARVSGAPLGPALEALAEALSDIARTKRQITAALAGPKATMRLVMALPVMGIIGGELGGQSSLAFLLGTGLGASVLALGTAMMLGAWWWLRLLAERAKPDPAALGLEMDLFAMATGGGALPERAQDLVAAVCSEYSLEVGEPDSLHNLVSLSRRAGVPVSGLARSSARARRDRGRTNAEERMARLGVSVVMPLGLLVLPAFVLVAVVPMAVSLWQGSLA